MQKLIFPIIGTKLKSAFNPFPETPKAGILENLRWIFHLFSLIAVIYIIILSKNRIVQSFAIGLIVSTVAITILTYSGFGFRTPQVALELIFITYLMQDLWLNSNFKIKKDKP